MVIVTHNMQQAARISDYTGFFYIEHMNDPGRLWEFDGDGQDILLSIRSGP